MLATKEAEAENKLKNIILKAQRDQQSMLDKHIASLKEIKAA